MKASRQSLSYEKKRLEYLLDNRQKEISVYKEELEGQKQINSLCAAFIFYFLEKEAKGEELKVSIPKEKIKKAVESFHASCVSDDNFYHVTLSPIVKNTNEEKSNE